MKLRRPAKLPHRRLVSRHQRLEALRKTHPPGLPVRVRQHEMVEEMLKRLTPDAHTKGVHRREIALAILPGSVLLREHHFLLRATPRTPSLHSPLQRPQLPLRKLTPLPPAQHLKDRPGRKSRRPLQQPLYLQPDPRKRIRSRPVSTSLPSTPSPRLLPVQPRRVLAHPDAHRRPPQRLPSRQFPHKPPHLPLRDHQPSKKSQQPTEQQLMRTPTPHFSLSLPRSSNC